MKLLTCRTRQIHLSLVRIACSLFFVAAIPLVTAKPYPAGIIALLIADTISHPIGNVSHKAAWTNPDVDGVRLRTCWNVIEPQKNSYNWKDIDQMLALGNQYQKRIGLSVAGGIYTPQWVYESGAIQYPLTDGSGNLMPIPWDVAFQNQWLPFIRALGARYDGNPALAYVCPTGFMQVCVMYLAKTVQDDVNLTHLALLSGYGSSEEAFVPAAKKIIAAFMEAFPTTPVILNPVPPFLTNGAETVKAVKDFGLNTYRGRFGLMYPSLRATRGPHKGSPGTLSYPKGFQMICLASDVPRIYNYPNPPYNPPAPTPLQDALANANSLQGQFVEVYAADLTVPANFSVLVSEGSSLKKNLPVQPPKGLQVQ